MRSEVLYQLTQTFCQHYLPKYGDRTVDQMVQAARSTKQNIAEGSSDGQTSTETELKLLGIARGSNKELLEDYLDYLKSHGAAEWEATSEKKIVARDFAKSHADWKDWKKFFVSRPAETLCNLMIVLIQQTKYLLDKMIAAQEADFKKHGGVRERMHAARTAARGEDWDKTIYSRLDGAATSDELAARADEMRKAISRAVWSIKRRKNWQ